MSKQRVRNWLVACAVGLAAGGAYCADQADLVKALSRSKLSLADGIRAASKDGAAVISAKFEFDDAGKLSLSVYVASKGTAVPAEDNVLEELSGSPEQGAWTPEVEVFKDVPHVARSSEQLTLLSLTQVTLLDLIGKAQPAHPGTVVSITPQVKRHKPVAVMLIANGGKLTELTYQLVDGKLIETRHP